MSDQSTVPTGRAQPRFTLPSAYTILFALIVLMAIATWIIPAGDVPARRRGQPDPRDVPGGRAAAGSGSWSTR